MLTNSIALLTVIIKSVISFNKFVTVDMSMRLLILTNVLNKKLNLVKVSK